jgi:hypothetical protein
MNTLFISIVLQFNSKISDLVGILYKTDPFFPLKAIIKPSYLLLLSS